MVFKHNSPKEIRLLGQGLSAINIFSKSDYASLGSEFCSNIAITGLAEPKIEALNERLAAELCLDSACRSFVDIFSGNNEEVNAQAISQAYAGHQYGNFNPFLGDGRTAILGKIVSPTQTVEIALKGVGLTPYGFKSDGLAGLSETLNEFRLSERLHQLGIPCCESLCVISGQKQVYRNGYEPAAILVRAAPCFVRFGTFELCYFRRNKADLYRLCNYVIERHFKELLHETNFEHRCYLFLSEVVTRTAQLVALWQKNQFVHGRMNTDNMSILGISLDLGSAYFLSEEPRLSSEKWSRNSRYCFENQAAVGLWNCNVLARSLSPILKKSLIKEALRNYEPWYFAAVSQSSQRSS